MSAPEVERLERLEKKLELLLLEVRSERLAATYHDATHGDPDWDNESVARERRAYWQRRGEQRRTSRQLDRLLRRIYD